MVRRFKARVGYVAVILVLVLSLVAFASYAERPGVPPSPTAHLAE
jgi:hypothetical protein